MSNELIKIIEYIVDKFNITLDLSEQQLIEFTKQFSNRLIAWQLGTSIISMIVYLILIIISIVLISRLEYKHNVLKSVFALKDGLYLGNDEYNRITPILLISIALILFNIMWWIPSLLSNTVGVVECIAFPEKVVLEFVADYIN